MRNFIWNIEVKIQKRGRDKRMLLRSGQLYKQKGGELCQIIALAKDYENLFKNTEVDMLSLCALVIGGIYYLELHKFV